MTTPIASVTLTFGLVAIPVQLVPATRSHRIAFRQIHRTDLGRVRNRMVCEIDGHRLDRWDIGRAWESPDGRLVPISDDDLEHLPLPTARTVEISGFLDLNSVPMEAFDQPYYLSPSTPAAMKPYVLFRDALARAGKAAVGKYALRGTGESLGLIYPKGDVLLVHRLRWPDEMRQPDPPRPDVITDDELAGALALIQTIGDVDMATMQDTYAAAAESFIDAKLAHQPAPRVQGPEHEDAASRDLMELLTEATKKAKREPPRKRRRPLQHPQVRAGEADLPPLPPGTSRVRRTDPPMRHHHTRSPTGDHDQADG